ncbi:MAG: dienelactone hydrolase [Oscillatoria sp. PMC 1068.18]|nr:dienelactone hydrolase [Oscillatoria sp. PMC 1076.18]MEC4989669.1 dienelactone hydrolase [Oscillatoria sp. PMC 1068.18]
MNSAIVRSLFSATKVTNYPSPYDTIHLRVVYPAQMSDSETAKNLGVIPANDNLAPFPVVIFFSGINCAADMYLWLAIELAKQGLVVVTFNLITQNIPGVTALTPGVNFENWKPNIYGTVPTATALPAILKELENLQKEGVLAGKLDLNKIILGGHSAGGRVAIENAVSEFFPSVIGAFAYAAHTAAPVMLGYEPETILPLSGDVPILMLGGTNDGVIAESCHQYGMKEKNATKSVVRTFREAIAVRGAGQSPIARQNNYSYLVLFEQANHFAIADPFDSTSARPFLETEMSPDAAAKIRTLMGAIINLFIQSSLLDKNEANQQLEKLLANNDTFLALVERK